MNDPQRPRRPTPSSPFRTSDFVPQRRAAQRRSGIESPTPASQPSPTHSEKDLASQREMFGFDDIPIDVDDVPMRQIIRAWLRRGTQHSDLDKHSKRIKSALSRKRLGGIKDDIKWAMAADLDEDELRPTPPPSPLPAASRPRATTHSPSRAAVNATPAPAPVSKSVDININFGELPKLPKLSLKKLIQRLKLSKKTLLICSIVLLFATISIAAWQLFAPNEYRLPIFGKEASSSDKASLPTETPEYSTLTPGGTAADKWTRISPESSAPAYSYADAIDGTRIIVTQQQLPNGVRSGDDAELARIAASFSATEKHTEGDTVFYLGSAGGSTQHVIASKDGLLILIRSEQSLDEDAWVEYLASLK